MKTRRGGRTAEQALQALLAGAVEDERAGRLAEAAKAYGQVLKRGGAHAGVMHALALLRSRMGDVDEALALLRRACKLAPNDPTLRNNLGNLLNSTGNQRGALKAYAAALELAPGHINARFNAARLLEQAGRQEEAITQLRMLVEQDPNDVQGLNLLGVLLASRGESDAARAAFEKALAVSPDSPEVLVNLGALHMSAGDTAEATRFYQRAVQADPAYVKVYENIARTRRFGEADRPFIEEVEGYLQRPGLDDRARGALAFALGKMYDDCGDAERAFAHYSEGNRLRRRQERPFDAPRFSADIDATIATFDGGWLAERSGAGLACELPIFVCGMMRSGTTLIEQIISSHPAVLGAGEIPVMPNLVEQLGANASNDTQRYPKVCRRLRGAELEKLGRAYVARLPAHPADVTRVTDKQTYNHLYLGLIAAALPGAALVHCERNAPDVCLSIFFQSFVDGHSFAYDLRDIALVYREHARLLRHWRDVLGERLLVMRYEDTVDDPATAARVLIAHCDLPWDSRCLDHTGNRRAVLTASNWQVRQPVYRSSVERWRRYEKHIGPLLEGLRE